MTTWRRLWPILCRGDVAGVAGIDTPDASERQLHPNNTWRVRAAGLSRTSGARSTPRAEQQGLAGFAHGGLEAGFSDVDVEQTRVAALVPKLSASCPYPGRRNLNLGDRHRGFVLRFRPVIVGQVDGA